MSEEKKPKPLPVKIINPPTANPGEGQKGKVNTNPQTPKPEARPVSQKPKKG